MSRLCQYLEQSSALPLHVSDFRYVVAFWHQSASSATGVENRGHFLSPSPVKLSRGREKCLS